MDYMLKNPLTNQTVTVIQTEMVEDELEASITIAVDRALEHEHDLMLFREDGRYIGRAVYESNFDDTGDSHAEFKRADVVEESEAEADEQPDQGLVAAIREDAELALAFLTDARQKGMSRSNLEWAVDQAKDRVQRIWDRVKEDDGDV